MRRVVLDDGSDFAEWREHARGLLRDGIEPAEVEWQVGEDAGLFAALPPSTTPSSAAKAGRVPREFLELSNTVLAHADPRRHSVLYRLVWRITHGESHLLSIATDEDVAWSALAAKAVRRDQHKMKAFVRFREVKAPDGSVFIAWFEPTHDILLRVAPFFVRRFAGMRWSILTPTRSLHWDLETLRLGTGAQKSDAPDEDALEALWLTYFANIFNPARLKVNAMVKEMPVRYWKNMPETVLIPALIRDASARMDEMVRKPPTIAKKAIPAPAASVPENVPSGSIADLRREAKACRACPLWEPATQTVFGAGPDDARIVVIGEQPGDQEDLAGRPFIGPAGQLFDRALAEARIDRRMLYITNTVKHFKFEVRGKRRLHARANAQEQAACHRWLEAELLTIKPSAIVCLGAMAAQAVFGKSFALMKERGAWRTRGDGTRAFATVHPSYLLRLPGEAEREEAFTQFVQDLSMMHDVPGFEDQHDGM
ncbi:MAG: UdgX family uracil-DNA binding protein [Dokdonella sp.]|uniref:UdgX family uracil-DNA binding protein n=1 Tax=Dokdonella sp. TaxID=2291710 RepID=UPI0032665D6D